MQEQTQPAQQDQYQLYCQHCGTKLTNGGIVADKSIYHMDKEPCFARAFESANRSESGVIRKTSGEEAKRLIAINKLLNFGPLEKKAERE